MSCDGACSCAARVGSNKKLLRRAILRVFLCVRGGCGKRNRRREEMNVFDRGSDAHGGARAVCDDGERLATRAWWVSGGQGRWVSACVWLGRGFS